MKQFIKLLHIYSGNDWWWLVTITYCFLTEKETFFFFDVCNYIAPSRFIQFEISTTMLGSRAGIFLHFWYVETIMFNIHCSLLNDSQSIRLYRLWSDHNVAYFHVPISLSLSLCLDSILIILLLWWSNERQFIFDWIYIYAHCSWFMVTRNNDV